MVCVLDRILFQYLVDDGLGLSWRMVGRWWNVEIEIHWFLVGFCKDPAIGDGNTHVQKDHRLARLVCGPGKLAIRQ